MTGNKYKWKHKIGTDTKDVHKYVHQESKLFFPNADLLSVSSWDEKFKMVWNMRKSELKRGGRKESVCLRPIAGGARK